MENILSRTPEVAFFFPLIILSILALRNKFKGYIKNYSYFVFGPKFVHKIIQGTFGAWIIRGRYKNTWPEP